MKRFYTLTLLLLTLVATAAQAQINFSVSYKRVSPTEYDIIFSGTAEPGWHVYSTDIPSGGPTPATFNTDAAKGVETVGKLKKGSGEKVHYDTMFEMDVAYFENAFTFTQRVRLTSADYELAGYLEYGACNDQSCLPPSTVECKLKGSDGPSAAQPAAGKAESAEKAAAAGSQSAPAEEATAIASRPDTLTAQPADSAAATAATTATDFNSALWTPVIDQLEAFGQENVADRALWYIFILGFAGGLIALFTPCVWPIIPMTVSFFLKRAKDRRKGIRDAITYGLSIIVIYVGLGLIITSIFGASALNDLSTNAIFNIFFCLMLVVFAASFFGGFEITLPSSWGAAVDSKAEKTTGLLSIFLMAFTLALVSFSCTGPIIGFLLVEMSTSGGSILAPTIGMLGFAIALALPFTLFALFPTWLKSAPKSGGWLNMVKVTLGFLELAFALKFLSVADLAYGWHILDRETFLALWIAIFALLGFYLLGLIKFPHDDEDDRRTSVPRFFLALASIAFAIYMVPGLWGAPCKAISAFAPPMYTQDFNLQPAEVKPLLNYEEGMAYAKEQKKPVILDFTGHGCVNCRKMEAAVWEDDKVKGYLTEDYVIISLYVDEKTPLPEPIVVNENGTERKLRTVGDKWSYLQRSKFGGQTQPFYVLVDNEGNPLNGSYSYDEDVDKFVEFLETGLKNYK